MKRPYEERLEESKKFIALPNDRKISDFLLQQGFEVPVVHFHGMPAYHEEHRTKHTFQVMNKGPKFYIIKNPKSRLPPTHLDYHHNKYNPEHDGQVYLTPENSLCVEIGFRGKPQKQKKEALTFELKEIGQLALKETYDGAHEKQLYQFTPHYFTEHFIASSDVLKSYAEHRKDFEQLLKTLAENGLKPKSS